MLAYYTIQAVEWSKTWDTLVIGDSTDLLVLVLYHCVPEHQKVYLDRDRKLTASGATWDIEAFVKTIGTETCKLLPFAHTILDCDITFRVHGVGKRITPKWPRDNEQFRENALKFSRIHA